MSDMVFGLILSVIVLVCWIFGFIPTAIWLISDDPEES